jgi:transposase InsO family protein
MARQRLSAERPPTDRAPISAYRPTKVERFHRTLREEWAYQRPYASDTERQAVFPDWLDWYNYHRPHTGIGGHPPASRVTNLSEQHTY